jgi:hypothetical protein
MKTVTVAGIASGNALLGTWKLKSYETTTGTGEKSAPYGEHPMGYLNYSADGRMQVIGASGGRTMPLDLAPTDEEQLALYKSMFAYAGTYSVQTGRVTHHVDVSWNEVWTGTDQVRFYEVNGNTLTITARVVDPKSGEDVQYVLVWKKVGSPS